MESIVRNVRDIDDTDRSAIERVIGRNLSNDQMLVIQVSDIQRDNGPTEKRPAQTIEQWTGVYEGLSEEEVEEIDSVIKTRANLTRHVP